MLRLLAALSLVLLMSQQLAAAQDVLSPEAAYERTSQGELLLIDVRSPEEWRKTGIPAGAKTVTIHNPDGIAAFMREVVNAAQGDKSRPIAFICAAGVRSSYAQKLAEDAGFRSVANVREGMMGSNDGPGWLAKRLPTENCGSC